MPSGMSTSRESEHGQSDEFLQAVREKFCVAPILSPSGWPIRCGSRFKSRCPSCATIYTNDWGAILRSGVFVENPELYSWTFLTLTAPSWGSTHHIPAPSEAGRRCRCGLIHTSDDGDLRGLPVDTTTYDYRGAVRWNRDLGRLWDATRSKLRLHYPDYEFAIIREWQLRGSLHTHALLRMPRKDAVDAAELGHLATSTVTRALDGDEVTWGSQFDSRLIHANQSTGQHVWYLLKALNYSLKATGYGLTHNGWDHLARLNRAAREISCGRCPSDGGCHQKCHSNFGSRSSVVSVSRRTDARPGWSFDGLTRSSLKLNRMLWAQQNAAESRDPGLLLELAAIGRAAIML